MICVFGRANYVRYDESSATRLVDIAAAVRDGYDGDRLKQFKGIGDTGVDALAPRDNAKLSAVLIRVSLDNELREKVRSRA